MNRQQALEGMVELLRGEIATFLGQKKPNRQDEQLLFDAYMDTSSAEQYVLHYTKEGRLTE